MNEVDAKNIKAIIKQREQKVKVLKGGTIDFNLLNEQSTDELKRMLKEYDNSTKELLETLLRNQVDHMFNKYAHSDENMIVFDCTHWVDWARELSSDDEPMEIEFDSCDSGYIRPINKYNMDDIDPDYFDDLNILTDNLRNLKCPYAYKYFKDVDSVNEEWYGCLAITRNYKVVPFVIRDDGYFTDDKYFVKILDEVLNMGSYNFYIYNI